MEQFEKSMVSVQQVATYNKYRQQPIDIVGVGVGVVLVGHFFQCFTVGYIVLHNYKAGPKKISIS